MGKNIQATLFGLKYVNTAVNLCFFMLKDELETIYHDTTSAYHNALHVQTAYDAPRGARICTAPNGAYCNRQDHRFGEQLERGVEKRLRRIRRPSYSLCSATITGNSLICTQRPSGI